MGMVQMPLKPSFFKQKGAVAQGNFAQPAINLVVNNLPHPALKISDNAPCLTQLPSPA
jgi:hypothetical protein